jgi:hypothetical protein
METFEEVGKGVGLNPVNLKRYIQYMKIRWANEEVTQCLTGYAKEWAERFLHEREYQASDIMGQDILDSMKYTKTYPNG